MAILNYLQGYTQIEIASIYSTVKEIKSAVQEFINNINLSSIPPQPAFLKQVYICKYSGGRIGQNNT
jgi:hypothetical protein